MKLENILRAGLEYSQLVEMKRSGKIPSLPDIGEFINTYPFSLLGLTTMNRFKEVCKDIGLFKDDDQYTVDADATCLHFSIYKKQTLEDLRDELIGLTAHYAAWDRY